MTDRARQKRFDELLRTHFDAMYAAAQRLTLSPADAEDLVQDVCIRAYECFDELERMDYPRAWLLKVTYNKFIDGRRSAKRTPVDLAETGAESVDPDSISHWLPEDEVDREIRIVRILTAMKRLDSEQAALVALRDIEGLSIAELEQLTGKPAGTIKTQLHRTRARLGRLLASDTSLRPELKAVGQDNGM